MAIFAENIRQRRADSAIQETVRSADGTGVSIALPPTRGARGGGKCPDTRLATVTFY